MIFWDAAAFVAAERRPASLQVITLDDRLADAMRKEGFALIDITAGYPNPTQPSIASTACVVVSAAS